MANLTYKRTTEQKLTIKGTLANDLDSITTTDKDGEEIIISLTDYFGDFMNKPVSLTISTKSEDDLTE